MTYCLNRKAAKKHDNARSRKPFYCTLKRRQTIDKALEKDHSFTLSGVAVDSKAKGTLTWGHNLLEGHFLRRVTPWSWQRSCH